MPIGISRPPASADTQMIGKRRRRVFLAGFVSALLIGAAALLTLDWAMASTSNAEFCVQCHEMEEVHARWSDSGHHTNRAGMTVDCVDCHLPPRKDFVAYTAARAWAGSKDICKQLLFDYDADASRQRVIATLPSERCLGCHDNLTGQPSLRSVGIVHAGALKQPDNKLYRCVACHDSLHGPKPEPEELRLIASADNDYCYVCHMNFNTDRFVVSHMEVGIGCAKCHGESGEHGADEDHIIAAEILYPKEKINASCSTEKCHPRKEIEKTPSHRPFHAGIDTEHKICTDCHGEHSLGDSRQRRWDKATRVLIEKDGYPVKPGEDVRSESSDMGMM